MFNLNYNFFTQITILLILIFIIFSNTDINRDGIAYIQQAMLISESYDLSSIIKQYPWPFFSYLIYFFSKITTLDFYYAAKLINLIFSWISIFIFIKIIKYLTNDNKLYYASLAIVITFIPLIDNYLTMILRDHGAWCFYLLGILNALKFIKEKKYIFSFYSQLFFIIGFLFRPDIIILMVASSFVIFLKNKNFKHLYKSNVLILILFIIVFILALFDFTSIQNSRLNELWQRPLDLINQFFMPLNIQSNNFILSQYISKNYIEIKLGIISSIFIAKWFSGFGLFHLVLFYFGKKNDKKYFLNDDLKNYLLWLFFVSILIVYINTYINNIVTVRYLMISYWIALIFSSLGLHFVWIKYQHKLIRILITLIIFIHICINIYDKEKKSIEIDVANWLKSNNVIINNLYSNNERIIFYTHKKLNKRVEYNSRIDFRKYHYLLIDDKNNLQYDENEINLIKEKINKDFKSINEFKRNGRSIVFYEKKDF